MLQLCIGRVVERGKSSKSLVAPPAKEGLRYVLERKNYSLPRAAYYIQSPHIALESYWRLDSAFLSTNDQEM
jgi:hypothetical protein